MSSSAHHARDAVTAVCGVITISDSRSEVDDASGARIRALLLEHGHQVTHYRIVRDDPEAIGGAIASVPPAVELLICNGGTGIARRDTTYEAITRLLDKEITGFGELFRMLSYEQIGAAAMLSRATAGVTGRCVLFSLPGSTGAVELAMTALILPQVGHVVGLVRS